MALLFEGLVARLEGSTGVGSLAGDRIYPVSLPSNPKLPAVTYQKISGEHLSTKSGKLGTGNALMQVDCYGNTYNDARDLAEEVRLSIQAFDGTTGGVRIRAVLSTRDQDVPAGEPGTDMSDRYRVSQDWRIWHDEDT